MAIQLFATQSRGAKTGRAVLHEEAQRVQASRLVRTYESHEFSIPTPLLSPTSINSLTVVNHAISCTCGRSNSGGAKAAFFLCPFVQRLLIRNLGSGPLLFRMDDVAADAFTVDAGEYSDLDVMEM